MHIFPLLPKWCLTDIVPGFYDLESKTAIGQTAKLYKTMQNLIETYNTWVEEMNEVINQFDQDANADLIEFKNTINKICHDYIKTMDMKIDCQDRKIEEISEDIKTNILHYITELINQMKESGEFDENILNAFESLNEKLIGLEGALTNQINNITSTIENLNNEVDGLKQKDLDLNYKIENVLSIPTGSIIGFTGDTIPEGYEEVENPDEIITITNDNGTAIKFPDGTLICRGFANVEANVTNTTITFPFEFISNNYNVIITNRYLNNAYVVWSVASPTVTSFGAYPVDTSTKKAPTFATRADYVVIGRWK